MSKTRVNSLAVRGGFPIRPALDEPTRQGDIQNRTCHGWLQSALTLHEGTWGGLAHFPRVVQRTLPAGIVFHNRRRGGVRVSGMWAWSVGKVARLVRLAVVVGVLAVGLGFVGVSGGSAQTVADIEVRDRLVADQEALLNVYRCMFGVDTEVVPGGCADGAPALPAKGPAPFAGIPTAGDLAVRDQLVADQEALLNVYRCGFRIDMQQVPGGCPEPVNEPDEGTEVAQQGDYHTCVTHTRVWCLLADGSWRVKKKPYIGVYEGSVQVCGAFEVYEDEHWDDIADCVPYKASSEQLEIFPHNCGPFMGTGVDLAEELERIFEPTMGWNGFCGFTFASWYYEPVLAVVYDARGENITDAICNYRDWAANRHEYVCLSPDTDPSDLNPFQYIGLPDNSQNREIDRSRDSQVQKPYLNYDLVLVREFCRRYPVAEVCAKILGTEN